MKTVYAVSVLMLICAGALFVSGAKRWPLGTRAGEALPESSSIELLRARQEDGRRGRGDVVPPLVAQAVEFALYLDPPKPPAPPEAAKTRATLAKPVPRPPVVAPKFRLLSTSCHRLHPEESLALISEPGKGDRWIRQGERVGHLVVESIEDGTLIYRDGSQVGEVKVALKQTAELARVAAKSSTSAESLRPKARLVNALRAGPSATPAPDAQAAD